MANINKTWYWTTGDPLEVILNNLKLQQWKKERKEAEHGRNPTLVIIRSLGCPMSCLTCKHCWEKFLAHQQVLSNSVFRHAPGLLSASPNRGRAAPMCRMGQVAYRYHLIPFFSNSAVYTDWQGILSSARSTLFIAIGRPVSPDPFKTVCSAVWPGFLGTHILDTCLLCSRSRQAKSA